MKKLLHTIEKFLGIYHWHPKIALRYLPVISVLKQTVSPTNEVLEVGSGGLGIAPYLKSRVIGLDLTFPPPLDKHLLPVKASALDIPFTNNSFPAVISLDMLEHIPPDGRKSAIYEMIRVAKTLVCIGVPCGSLAQAQDEALAILYKKSHAHNFHFLAEQVEYGLPSKEWLAGAIVEQAHLLNKKIEMTSQGNINLQLRMFLMKGWISQNIIVNIFFRKVLLLAIPLLRLLNQEPTYRQLFFVKILS